jgi:hypothetical protein
MRLTLRTLLAWLDHVLPADEQKELGDKVTGSTAAQQLVDRIRKVVERPTISAPKVEGKGLAADANSVSEYLTNTLDPEQLESFERICVESDMHLAEVAACHNLLATAESDPTVFEPLDPRGRERLLAAVKQRSAALFSEIERREAIANARAVQAAIKKHEEEDTFSLADGAASTSERPAALPEKRSSRSAWAAAATALALLLTLVALLVSKVMPGKDRKVAARPEPVRAVVEETPPVPREEPPAAAIVPATEPVAEAAVVQPPPVEEAPVANVEPEPVKPEPSAEPAPEQAAAEQPAAVAPFGPPPPAAPPEAPRVPFGDALAIAATPPPAVPAAPSPTPRRAPAPTPSEQPTPPSDASDAAAKPAAPASPPAAAAGFVGTDGVLFHRATAAGQAAWELFPANAALEPREDLIAPAGFHPDINIRGLRIRLMPGTRANVSVDPDGTPRLAVAFGRAVVRASSGDARLGVTADGLVGTIAAGLTEPVGISVELERFAGADPAAEPTRVRAGIVAASGGIVWRQAGGANAALAGIAPEGMLEARTAIIWESTKPGAAVIERLTMLPEWVAGTPQQGRLEKAAAESLATKVATVAPLDRALRELAADRRVENRIVAVTALALLGEYDDLVELLSADAPGRKLEAKQWIMLEGDTVPLALARGARSAERLREAFEDRGPHGKAQLLYDMARGFTNDELAAGADQALVAALDDDDLVVRRYAIKCLCDVMQPSATDKLRYRPDGLLDLRREGVNWWRSQLEKGIIRRGDARPNATAATP